MDSRASWRAQAPRCDYGPFGVGYGFARIFCEFFREPDPMQEALPNGWTMGMVLSLPLVFVGAGIVVYSLRWRGVSE